MVQVLEKNNPYEEYFRRLKINFAWSYYEGFRDAVFGRLSEHNPQKDVT